MIIFELACGRGHTFEGWFASAEDFTRQNESSLVRCPVCDEATVAIVPSARVHVGRSADSPPPAPDEPLAPVAKDADDAVAGIPADLLRKLRDVIKSTEDVGRRFPDEARKIHYEEAPARAIRGQASQEEASALREEGIDFTALPPFLTREQH
jgi:hypothetical protein